MCRSSSLVIALHTIVNIVLVENGVIATVGIPGLTSSPLATPVLDLPELDIEIPCTSVPPCDGCDPSFATKELINQINNIKVLKSQKVDRRIAPCENNTKVLADALNGFSCSEGIEKKCGLSYLSYFVFIISMDDGKMDIIGQGVQLNDCTIYTALAVPLSGEEGLWVKYSNNVMKKVICMKDPNKSKYVLSDAVYSVILIVESNCCTDCTNRCTNCCSNCPCGGPEIQTYNRSPIPIVGYLITRRDCSSTDYSLQFTLGVLLSDPTDAAASILVVDDPNKICSFQGAALISTDCKVLGIAVAKAPVATGTLASLPLAQQVNTKCVQLIIPIEL